MEIEIKSVTYLRELSRSHDDWENDPACLAAEWAADEIERLQAIVVGVPAFTQVVADDCGCKYIDQPCIYQRGNAWRYHRVRAGNQWADGITPLEAAEKARER